MEADDEVRVSRSLYASVNQGTNGNAGLATIQPSASSDDIELTAPAAMSTGATGTNTGAGAGAAQNKSSTISFSELNYGVSSYHVIVTPVTLTMILSALVVTNIQTPQIDTSSSINSFYNAFQISDDYSVAENLGISIVNALIIVSCVAAATFGLVLFYKYRYVQMVMITLYND